MSAELALFIFVWSGICAAWWGGWRVGRDCLRLELRVAEHKNQALRDHPLKGSGES